MFTVLVRGREVFVGTRAKAIQRAYRLMERKGFCTIVRNEMGQEVCRFSA